MVGTATMSKIAKALAIAAAAAGAGCFMTVPDPDRGYACESGADCLHGYNCVDGVCRLNQAPVVLIQPSGFVDVRHGTTQRLDASHSYDPDGEVAGFEWHLPSTFGAGALGLNDSDLRAAAITVTAPSPPPPDPELAFEVVVTDDSGATATATVTVVVVTNERPVVVVTPAEPRAVREGGTLVLDASGSTDDTAVASFAWQLPAGTAPETFGLGAADLTAATLTIVAPEVAQETNYQLNLTVTDDEALSAVAPVPFTVVKNQPPVVAVDPASPANVSWGRVVVLDGTASSDPEGTALSFLWTLPGGQPPASYGLADEAITAARISPRMPSSPGNTLTFSLTAIDAEGKDASSDVILNVVNTPPVVRLLGSDALSQTLTVARSDTARIRLDLSMSSDADGDDFGLTFGGDIGPGGVCAGTADFDFRTMPPSFRLPVSPPTAACQGTGPFSLTVVADDDWSTSETMVIQVSVANGAPVAIIEGPDFVVAPSAASFVATSSFDPDGDAVTYAWSVRSASAPAVDCGTAWSAIGTGTDTLGVAAPSSPDPECDVVVVALALEDPSGAIGEDVQVVTNGTAPVPSYELIAPNRIASDNSTQRWGVALVPCAPADGDVAYTWTATVESGACGPSDLVVEPVAVLQDGACGTVRNVSAIRVGCTFRITVEANIAGAGVFTDSFLASYERAEPRVEVGAVSIGGSTCAGNGECGPGERCQPTRGCVLENSPVWQVGPASYELHFPPGAQVTLWTQVTDLPDGTDLSYAWGGDTSIATCAPEGSCTGTIADGMAEDLAVTFAAATAPGAYELLLQLDNGTSVMYGANLLVVIDPCVYAGTSVSDSGALLGSAENPHLSIQDAIDAAVLVPDANVCLLSGTYTQDFVVRATGTNTPTIRGGYSATTGQPIGVGSIVRTTGADGITFEPGATNHLEDLSFVAAPTLVEDGPTARITIEDAAPTLDGVDATGGGGALALAVDIHANAAEAAPVVVGGHIVGSGDPAARGTCAIRVRETAGDALLTADSTWVAIGVGGGSGRGICVEPGADAHLSGVRVWAALDPSVDEELRRFNEVVGIDVVGEPARTASLSLADSLIFLAYAPLAEDAAGVRLRHTDSVEITGTWIGGQAGNRAGFGIADGNVFEDGTVDRGNSSNLSIHDNRYIVGVGFAALGGCSGSRFAPAIFLAGTENASITSNRMATSGNSDFPSATRGRPPPVTGQSGGGGCGGGSWTPSLIFQGAGGGVVSYDSDWPSDNVPPAAPGLWLIDTVGVQVTNNTITSGFTTPSVCDPPSQHPVVNAVLDGLPAIANGTPGLASLGLVLDGNTISCSREPLADGVEWCVAVDMQGAAGATLINNIVTTLAGEKNAAVRLSGGTSLDVVNNLLDVDVLFTLEDPPPLGSIMKYGIYADQIGPNALRVHNNIVLLRQDAGYDDPDQTVAIYELVSGSTTSAMGGLSHNLLYIEGDLVSSTDTPAYVRVEDADNGATQEYDAASINSISGPSANTNNIVDNPRLTSLPYEEVRALQRITPSSPAYDAGSENVAPDHDIDGDSRGIRPDIGHDEWAP